MNRRGAELVSNKVAKWVVLGFWVTVSYTHLTLPTKRIV